MRAVVLVGGEGTRLRPLTATTPKQLLPVAEVPMIERVLAHLGDHGVTEAVLSMGYQPDAFLAAFPGDRCGKVRIHYAVEPQPMDTAGAVAFAAREAGMTETFLVVNGDVLTELDVTSLVAFHRSRNAEATIHLTRVEDPSSFGVVPTSPDGRVTAFVEKPPPGEAPTDLINAGTYVVEPSVLGRIPTGRRVSIERETFPAMVADGSLFALASDDYWIDTGTPPKYLQANLDLLTARGAGEPAQGAVLRPDGAWALGSAVIEGEVTPPALIGDAALVARGSRVNHSIVGAGGRVLEGAEVRRSVLLPGAVVRAGATVEDSIIGAAAIVGEGAKVRESVLGGEAEVPAGCGVESARVPG